MKKEGLGFLRISSRSNRLSRVTLQTFRKSALYASSVACDSSHLQYSLTDSSLGPGITSFSLTLEGLPEDEATREAGGACAGRTLMLTGEYGTPVADELDFLDFLPAWLSRAKSRRISRGTSSWPS